MQINKRSVLLIIFMMVVAMPSFAQRFTKKEQAKREARAINYFYGNSFTVSAGYVHSWLTRDRFTDSTFGRSGAYQNTRDSYAFSFSWDYNKKKHHGFRVSAVYAQFGGEKIYYNDLGLGYGRQQRYDLTQVIHLNEVMVEGKYRYFIPVTYKSRFSLDAGIYVSRIVGSYSDAENWDFGPMVGIGYDWRHVSLGVDYMPGVWNDVIDGSTARVSALMFNVGFHFWK